MSTQLFNKQHYLVIKNVVSKETCELLSNYATFKAHMNPYSKKGDALSGVHREYGDALMEQF